MAATIALLTINACLFLLTSAPVLALQEVPEHLPEDLEAEGFIVGTDTTGRGRPEREDLSLAPRGDYELRTRNRKLVLTARYGKKHPRIWGFVMGSDDNTKPVVLELRFQPDGRAKATSRRVVVKREYFDEDKQVVWIRDAEGLFAVSIINPN